MDLNKISIIFAVALSFYIHSCRAVGNLTLIDDGTLSHRNGRPHSKARTTTAAPYHGSISSNEIPLTLIRDLNREEDLLRIFEKYVSNVKVKEVNGQKYVVDLNNKPIDVTIADKPHRVGPFTFRQFSPNSKVKPGNGTSFTGFSRTGFIPGVPVPIPDRSSPPSTDEKIRSEAKCEPELKTVEVPVDDEHGYWITPRCVRINQCGGCCGSSLLKCEATETKPVQVEVKKFEYQAETRKFEYKRTDTIEMQAATACRCGCKIKPRDCSSLHVHDHNACRCVCKNEADQLACLAEPLKHWNTTNCACECSEVKECSSGYIFSPDTCDCILEPTVPDSSEKKKRRRSHRRRNTQV